MSLGPTLWLETAATNGSGERGTGRGNVYSRPLSSAKDANFGSSLSSSTMAALQEYYKEKAEQDSRFEDLKAASEPTKWSMDLFAEDWNASQFWVCGP